MFVGPTYLPSGLRADTCPHRVNDLRLSARGADDDIAMLESGAVFHFFQSLSMTPFSFVRRPHARTSPTLPC